MPFPLVKPMKMTDIPVTDFEQYVNDDDWVLEQKHDGARALIYYRSGTFLWLASGGGPLKFAAAKLHFAELEKSLQDLANHWEIREAIFDGELMPEDGSLRLFDLPYLHVSSLTMPSVAPENSYTYRRAALVSLMSGLEESERLQLTYSAQTPEEKQALWDRINEAGVEGGMLKHLYAPYESGTRTKMQRKLKLVKSADVVVMAAERKFDTKGMVTHGSADLAVVIDPKTDPRPYRSEVTGKRLSEEEFQALANGTKAQKARALAHTFDPRTMYPIGAASLIGKDHSIGVGSVVEINYLYWTGEGVIQPRIMRKRREEEKLAKDCTIDQLPAYSKAQV